MSSPEQTLEQSPQRGEPHPSYWSPALQSCSVSSLQLPPVPGRPKPLVRTLDAILSSCILQRGRWGQGSRGPTSAATLPCSVQARTPSLFHPCLATLHTACCPMALHAAMTLHTGVPTNPAPTSTRPSRAPAPPPSWAYPCLHGRGHPGHLRADHDRGHPGRRRARRRRRRSSAHRPRERSCRADRRRHDRRLAGGRRCHRCRRPCWPAKQRQTRVELCIGKPAVAIRRELRLPPVCSGCHQRGLSPCKPAAVLLTQL